jgi:hypothetical protein
MSSSVTASCLFTCQFFNTHFGGDENKFNIIDYFLCDQTYFENLSDSETVIENPKEKDPAKVITRVERYHVPNYLRARCIFFKKFLEEKKNDGKDLNYESFYMVLMLDDFMAWKAEEMTMNTSSPCVAKSRDLVADFRKGIKRDPSLFPSLKHIDNWPTLKRETMAQAFAQDIVNVFNLKYTPWGSEEKDLFTLQLYYIYAIFCSNLKTGFRQKLVRDYESLQNAQAIWKELSNDAEKSMVAQLNATGLLPYTHTAQVENWKGTMLSFILHYQEQIWLYDQLQPPNEQTSDHAKMIFHEAYEFGFDIDTPTDIVQAHMCDPSGVIPKETFGQLSPESRKAWSQLSDNVWVDILQALQANGSQRSQESTRTPSLHDKPEYSQTRVPQNAMLNRTVQFNTTDDDATPTDPDLDE